MAWLHTWTGLLVGWVLLLIFMAGTASYYRDEISRWMRPELTLPSSPVEPAAAAQAALAFLEGKAPNAETWTVTLPDARNPALRVFWRNPETPSDDGKPRNRRDRFGNATLDAQTGQVIAARETRGGDFFYRLHFDLHYIPVIWARWIVGFCSMFMLVAIITGVITHKKIFKDFFTFRPGKGQRSWLDFHNVSAVLALPYHAMITYTGIVTLMFLYLPWGVQAAYPKDADAFWNEAFATSGEVRAASGERAVSKPMAELLNAASAHWHGAPVARFVVHHPGDRLAVIEATQRDGRRLSSDTPSLRLDAVSGTLLDTSGEPGGASQTRGVMVGLHVARFADSGLRALFFVSGLIGCLMVASGVILWAIKERPKHLKAGRIGFGLRLVDALNIGTVAGLPIAFATYFWANRLLPAGLPGREKSEALAFFVAWGAALLAAFVWPRRAMWSWQLYAGAAAFALLPVLNALTSDAHLLANLRRGDGVLVGFDLVVLALGVCLAIAARRMQAWQPAPTAAERRARSAPLQPAPLQPAEVTP
jgi:uncharacterized iron-regulated membrane protein